MWVAGKGLGCVWVAGKGLSCVWVAGKSLGCVWVAGKLYQYHIELLDMDAYSILFYIGNKM